VLAGADGTVSKRVQLSLRVLAGGHADGNRTKLLARTFPFGRYAGVRVAFVARDTEAVLVRLGLPHKCPVHVLPGAGAAAV
jgi:hypothetical protein